MSIKYALFDFDGTLIDSNEAIISSLNYVAIKFRGKPFVENELDEILGKPIQEQMRFLAARPNVTSDTNDTSDSNDNDDTEEVTTGKLVEMYRIEYRRVQDDLTKIYDGIIEMLQTLKSMGVQTGIVSNKGRHGIDHGINAFDLHELIEVTVSLDDVDCPKPHEEGIFKALNLLGADASAVSETLFMGDSGHDIETAKNAGCISVLVSWTLINMDQLMALKPDYVIQSPHEIIEIIKGR